MFYDAVANTHGLERDPFMALVSPPPIGWISTLDAKGVPSVVERTLMAPPRSQFGPVDDARRKELIERSPLNAAYRDAVDRESAYELLA